MTATLRHDHTPIYRVTRKGWADPLDSSFSQRSDNRWNTAAFPALYCCCSTRVARAVVRDLLRIAAVSLDDLQESALPQLVEIDWTGQVVDMISEAGITSAGFPANYPVGVDHLQTRPAAVQWHSDHYEAVVCRSASLARLGLTRWFGDHRAWSELAIYPLNSAAHPHLIRRRKDLTWLTQPT